MYMGWFAKRPGVDKHPRTTAVTGAFLPLDGSAPMTGPLDVGGHPIENVDSENALCLKRDGSDPALGDLNMNGYDIKGLKDVNSSTPAENAVNKKYVDQGLRNKFNAIPQKDFNMNDNAIENLASPFNLKDVVNKNYVDESFLRRDGTKPMYGPMNTGQQ